MGLAKINQVAPYKEGHQVEKVLLKWIQVQVKLIMKWLQEWKSWWGLKKSKNLNFILI
jgi:hypothetical protein